MEGLIWGSHWWVAVISWTILLNSFTGMWFRLDPESNIRLSAVTSKFLPPSVAFSSPVDQYALYVNGNHLIRPSSSYSVIVLYSPSGSSLRACYIIMLLSYPPNQILLSCSFNPRCKLNMFFSISPLSYISWMIVIYLPEAEVGLRPTRPWEVSWFIWSAV